MKMTDLFIYAVRSLRHQRLRSMLTIFGMVIGVIAITVILAVTEGFQKDINDQLAAFGTDQMVILPLSSSEQAFSLSVSRPPTNGKLFQEDLDDVLATQGVQDAGRATFGRASLAFKGKNITATIYGADSKIFDMSPSIEIESGRLYKEGERSVAVFAATASTDFFGKDKVDVGSVVQINSKNYRVVGVLKEIGTSLSSTDDMAIYIPFEDSREAFRGSILEDEVGFIQVKTEPGADVSEVKEAIEEKIATNHRVRPDEKDFSILTFEELSQSIGTILLSIQLALAAVTLIASAVGAIGISNTMFMNVLQRTNEIGILKALGATSKDIILVFLLESALIGLAGGLIGLALGAGLLEIISQFGIPVFLRLRIIAFVFAFSVGVGVLAGFVPSYRAARLDPVDALRD